MTPSEFIYTWLGWSQLENNRFKQEWERERWSVWIATIIQMDPKDRKPMIEMFPLPWESECIQSVKLTKEQRKERVKEILNRESVK